MGWLEESRRLGKVIGLALRRMMESDRRIAQEFEGSLEEISYLRVAAAYSVVTERNGDNEIIGTARAELRDLTSRDPQRAGGRMEAEQGYLKLARGRTSDVLELIGTLFANRCGSPGNQRLIQWGREAWIETVDEVSESMDRAISPPGG